MLDKEIEEKRMEAEAHRQEAQRQHELRLLSTVSQQMANVFKVNVGHEKMVNWKLLRRSTALQSFNPSPFAGRCDSAVASEPSDKPQQVNGCDDYPTAAVYSNI